MEMYLYSVNIPKHCSAWHRLTSGGGTDENHPEFSQRVKDWNALIGH